MQTQMIYVTYDGARHDSYEAATRHLDRAYGVLITEIVREIRSRNYAQAAEWLDDNSEKARQLITIKDDIRVIED